MTEETVIALLSLIGTLTGSFGGIITSNRLTAYRIEQLEKRVEKHNGLVERTYQLEEDMQVEKEKIKVINNRIRDLEDFHKPPRSSQQSGSFQQ